MPRWVFPSIILFLLLLALAFRWEEGPKRTTDSYIIIYQHDSWTGQNWFKVYSPRGIKEFTTPRGKETEAKENRDIATGIWSGMVIITLIWLLFSIRKPVILNKIGWKTILLGIGSLFLLYFLIAICVVFKPEMLPALIAFLVISAYFAFKEEKEGDKYADK